MKKTDFLNYVANLIDSKENAYYDENEQYFYLYHEHFMFKFKSDPSSASLIIEETVKAKTKVESISLTYDEAVFLLEKIIPLTPNNNNAHQSKVDALGEGVFNGYIELLQEFLKNYNPAEDIAKFAEKNDLANYVLYFPLDNINHICRIGRVANYEKKTDFLLTSLVKIPFFFLDDNTPKSACIPYEIIIPAWKIKDYPILEHFAEPKLFGTDFSITFENMVKKFVHGKELFKEVLEHTMPELNKKAKSNKI